MEENDVIGARQSAGGGVEPVLGLDTPWRRELGLDIDRAVEPDGRKNVRQGVHEKPPSFRALFYSSRKRSASQAAMRRRARPCADRSTRPIFMKP